MQPEEIAAGYDQIAEIWCGPDFPADNGIAQHRRALSFASGAGRALDVGCGCNGRIIELLKQSGYTSEGLDLSNRMLELARQRQPEVKFHHGDIVTWQTSNRYDFISAWDSIWHVPLAQQEQVLNKLLALLEPDGVLIFSMGGLHEAHEKQDRAMGPPMYYSTLGIPATLALINASGAVVKHLEFDQSPEQHLYVIAQRL